MRGTADFYSPHTNTQQIVDDLGSGALGASETERKQKDARGSQRYNLLHGRCFPPLPLPLRRTLGSNVAERQHELIGIDES